MAHKKKNWLSPERREAGGFVAFPHCLLASQVYIGLSAHAVKLLNDLLAQFKGFNNGNLCLAWTLMEKRGWKSRDTLNKARKELLDTQLIEVSRHGDRKRATLYALTFYAIDECGGKLDIKATERPVSTWRLHEPLPPLKIRITPTPSGLNQADMTRSACYLNQVDALCDTPAVLHQTIPEII